MTKMNLFIPLTKVDEENRLVYGTVTAEQLDKANEIMDYGLSKPNFESWSEGFSKATGGKSVGNLRVMHKDQVAGKFTELNFDDDAKAITGCAKVVDDGEWGKVLEGCYTGFSIGGSYGKITKQADGSKRYEAKPSEVSLVDNPCLGAATFELLRADGATEMRKFKTEAASEDEGHDPAKIEEKARKLCKAAGFEPDEELSAATDDMPAVMKWHGFVEDAKRDLDAPGSVDLHPGIVHKWLASDGKPFDTKAEAISHDALTKAQAKAAEIAAPASEAMAKIDAALDRIEGKEEVKPFEALSDDDKAYLGKATGLDAAGLETFVNAADADLLATIMAKRSFSADQRKEAAKSGEAMPDGSFPIKNKEDLANAVKAYGRAKDKAAAKAHIIKRAKALGATDDLPMDWEGSTAKKGVIIGAMRKGMYSVSRLANLLESLSWLRVDAKSERDMEGDDSTVPEMLDDNLARLGATLKAMVEEEVAELATMGVDPDDMEQISGLLECAHSTDGLLKAFENQPLGAALTKALGSENFGKLAKGVRDDADGRGTGDGGTDRLTKAEGDALSKEVTDLTDRLVKMAARIEHLEKQPAAPLGVRRITKEQDAAGAQSDAGDSDPVAKLASLLDELPEGERSMAMMKAAMRAGRALTA